MADAREHVLAYATLFAKLNALPSRAQSLKQLHYPAHTVKISEKKMARNSFLGYRNTMRRRFFPRFMTDRGNSLKLFRSVSNEWVLSR
jgi:hypothetical protein